MARSDYTLAVFDENGNETRDQQGNLGSEKAAARMQNEATTDVFLMSHGWKGDVPSAIQQYDAWTDALMKCKDDLTKLGTQRPGFKPLIVGFHWPSQPWGDEAAIASFALTLTAPAFDPVADYAQRLGGTPEIRAAVQKVFTETAASPSPNKMSPGLAQAYIDLNNLLNLGADGAGGAPGADRAPFDPVKVFEASKILDRRAASFGGFTVGGLLDTLRSLSFWTMKDRGRKLGETAGANLLKALQKAAAGRDVHFHLMGHSFGCIVVSAMAAGAAPVQSLVLVQGAFSLWSYANAIPKLPLIPGYFRSVLKDGKVLGPIATTQSPFDRAVGVFYPLGAGAAGQASFDVLDLPIFGGVGTWGLQGVEHIVPLGSMLGVPQQYGFQPGQIYNIASGNIIKALDGISGAHSDISHPEVGHVVWQAAMA